MGWPAYVFEPAEIFLPIGHIDLHFDGWQFGAALCIDVRRSDGLVRFRSSMRKSGQSAPGRVAAVRFNADYDLFYETSRRYFCQAGVKTY